MRSGPVRRRSGGLTLVELMIAMTIILIVIAVAIPQLVTSRMRATEAAAVANLRSVVTAQLRFQQGAYADEDFDNVGEFGTFAEMGGRVGIRGLATKLQEDLTLSMSMVDVAGEVQKGGYVFRIYLPQIDGRGCREVPYGGMAPGVVDPDLAEQHWVCYAWPATNGISGAFTYFVNESGHLLQSEDSERSGQNSAYVRAGDAFHTDDPDRMVDEPAIGTTGSDGAAWQLVE